MTNPFFEPSTLPFGMPPFADIEDEHFAPAFDKGMAEQLAEIEAITSQPDTPTFENTTIPLEKSGQLLNRVATVFFNKTSADGDAASDALEEVIAPQLAAHNDAISLNSALYERISSINEGLDDTELDAEARYLVERYFTEFTLAGAGLSEDAKATLRDYNSRLSTLTTKFEKNLLADTNDLAIVVDSIQELDGLEPSEISAAASAANDRGLTGKYLITLILPTNQPHLSVLKNADVRGRVLAASRSRGIRGGTFDNRALVLEIAKVRSQRAALLGYESHAAWVTADETAQTPQRVADMLGKLAPAAARNAREEHAALEKLAGAEVTAADWAFYAEKVRAEQYNVDTTQMRPYFEAERVLRDGVFFAATQLYGVTFTERRDLPAYHPDVRVFEVTNEDGSEVGLYTLDLYTRDSKRGGAWMNSLISQSDLLGHPVIVTNNLNVPKPAAGETTLLTYDEVNTLFHEFGHALHGLFARVTYPKFAGTNTYRDFVEFPSQVNEMWMLWPEVLDNYAKHYETGEPMPREIVERIQASAAFNEGFLTSEYLAAALIDQAWHRIAADDNVTDVAAFEAQALAEVGLDNAAVPPRYSSTYFQHIFANSAYDAGYYSYIWSEVLDADTVEWFTENGGLTRANGDRFRSRLLGVGGAKNPLEAFRDFRGRDAELQPLLNRRGLN
ncbi:M3 family metallopeptidase [Salinibacterium sp. NSLL150]|uniref:M3 family metallopeptidase n=1 Tax=unclassified Salinibacterium TaxID=2632331 RepID=UPI0018CEFFDB|nr:MULTISPECIES: M3 family metallopeptidase [unclassified Salinibacterium]MBH0098833.1 M3 family metallopeptidase [Salinibacterium sp. NSLL35]MBH0101588.1 M3 family metallopeptidase [Salinibacterium sp. NSLL150]MBH0104347.1 M3 family metallopeptidase [Salinibacterium sp. NSLL16]MBH0107108.1 M3 family metallopeptidase [Salinibacterium sp. NSLL17]